MSPRAMQILWSLGDGQDGPSPRMRCANYWTVSVTLLAAVGTAMLPDVAVMVS